uniref:Helitron helicase-like domain-containing protein n=1 Tax=Fagus sylvatica TaxID=28930 RepID=A0A2N9FGK8_FAGSY
MQSSYYARLRRKMILDRKKRGVDSFNGASSSQDTVNSYRIECYYARLRRRWILARKRIRNVGSNPDVPTNTKNNVTIDRIECYYARLRRRLILARKRIRNVGSNPDVNFLKVGTLVLQVMYVNIVELNFGMKKGKLTSRKPKDPKFRLCCSDGIVHLPLLKDPPPFLARLLGLNGGKVDYSVNRGSAPYVFRLNGQNYHKIGSLLPVDGEKPKMARDRFIESDVRDVKIRLIGTRGPNERQYNIPTSSEVAAVIVGDFSVESSNRDIIVEHTSSGLQRISELHPSFMSLQYPLLFPYGEDGFRTDIIYRNTGGRQFKNRKFVTMREYYAYRLQQHPNEGHTLILGGRLFQQFIVDAYTCIEEARLRWVRDNQEDLRREIYSGLMDAVLRGDSDPLTVGKRVVLPSTFVGGPRYMAQIIKMQWPFADGPKVFLVYRGPTGSVPWTAVGFVFSGAFEVSSNGEFSV